MTVSKVNKIEQYIVIFPSNIHCFNKIMNYIQKIYQKILSKKSNLKFLIKIYDLCANTVEETVDLEKEMTCITQNGGPQNC